MRNPPAAYKHDNPTHKQFGQSGDSSLLRKGYAEGGQVENYAAKLLTPEEANNLRVQASEQALREQSIDPAGYNQRKAAALAENQAAIRNRTPMAGHATEDSTAIKEAISNPGY